MEQDLPSSQSDITDLQPHSCTCCQKLLIHNVSTYGNITGKFSYTKVAEMASSGCLLFETVQKKFDRISYPPHRTRHELTLKPRTWTGNDILLGLDFKWEMKPEDPQVRGYEDEDDEDNRLFAFVPEGNLAHEFVDASPFNLHPGSAESFARIKERFHRCRRRHTECQQRIRENQQNLAMPKRLLDVGQLGDPFIGLLEASDDARVSFAIGSYVWGKGLKENAIKQAQTTKENIGYRMASGIEVTGLPKSIQDLIKVTRQIGFRYLWLDAFCIVQDDEDDKDHQFNSIAEFYKQADILISAASASHCGEGFLHSRIVNRCYGSIFELPYEWKVNGDQTQGSLFLSEMDLDGSTDNEPVHMRIWTFQEHLVSSRIISFGSRQIKWTCQKEKNFVDGGSYYGMIDDLEENLRIAFSPSQYPSETPAEKNCRVWSWMRIVEEYSKRDYSRLEDRVPAFYEAMSLLAPQMGWTEDQCVYGIWRTDASRQLLWKKSRPLTTQEVEELEVAEKDGNPVPSWSWATLPGGVIYEIGSLLRCLGDTDSTIEFQMIDGQPPCLTMEGFIQEADWIENYTTDVSADDVVQLFQVDLDVEMPPQPVFLLDLSASYRPPFSMGLVLIKIRGYLARFKRCGRFEAIEANPDGSPILFSNKVLSENYFALQNLFTDNLNLNPERTLLHSGGAGETTATAIDEKNYINNIHCLLTYLHGKILLAEESDVARFSEAWSLFPPDSFIYARKSDFGLKVWHVVQGTGDRRYMRGLDHVPESSFQYQFWLPLHRLSQKAFCTCVCKFKIDFFEDI